MTFDMNTGDGAATKISNEENTDIGCAFDLWLYDVNGPVRLGLCERRGGKR